MQESYLNMTYTSSQTNSSSPPISPSIDDLARIFNTALVATRVSAPRDFSAELYALIESPAFRTILNAIRQLARLQGISDREAAESLIQTFRKVDRIWGDYIFQEGIDRLKNQLPTGNP